ncbi:MAG TPA: XdhC family protein [Burkholderiaceae bacterium]|nr:XdhC family protein [Burkholderiaceae bacterium]
MYDRRLVNELCRLQREDTAYCTVTIVDAKGSIPQEVGATAVFGSDGLLYGTVGGGRVEARCAEEVRTLLASGRGERTRFERLNLFRDLGMTCAGEVALYYEVHQPIDRWEIVVFGAGHVAQKLCRFLVELDCHTVCIDTRSEWLARLPQTDRLEIRHVGSFVEGVSAVRDGASVLLMTMGHATDGPILEALARSEVAIPYMGVIGSASKAAIMRRELRKSGVPAVFIDRIACPIGEKVGDNTPAEIAVGIVSKLVRIRRSQDKVALGAHGSNEPRMTCDARSEETNTV